MTVRGDRDFGPVSEGVMRSGRPGGADEASDEIESVDLCFTGFLGRVGDGGPFADGKVDETWSYCLIPKPSTVESSVMSVDSDRLMADGGWESLLSEASVATRFFFLSTDEAMLILRSSATESSETAVVEDEGVADGGLRERSEG